MGRKGGTNPEDGWPAELRSLPKDLGLSRVHVLFERLSNIGEAQWNAVQRWKALSMKRANTVDAILAMMAGGRMRFTDSDSRREFLRLMRVSLDQLRTDEEIVIDLAKIMERETSDIALREEKTRQN